MRSVCACLLTEAERGVRRECQSLADGEAVVRVKGAPAVAVTHQESISFWLLCENSVWQVC